MQSSETDLWPLAPQCSDTAPKMVQSVPFPAQSDDTAQQAIKTVSFAPQWGDTNKTHLKYVSRQQGQKLYCHHCNLCGLKKNLKKHNTVQRGLNIEPDITALHSLTFKVSVLTHQIL